MLHGFTPCQARTISIQPIREPPGQLIEHIMAGRGLDTFMPEGFLRQANIAPCELGTDKAPKVMRLDVRQPDLGGSPLDDPPSRREMHRARGRAVALACKAGKDVGTFQGAPGEPGLDAGVRFMT